MQCHEIMTCKVFHVGPEVTVEHAARKMFEEMLGFLPVCDAEGRPIGVLTDRDITLRVCAEGLPADEIRVEQIMSRPVISCRPYDPVARAERLMSSHRKARILVVDEQEKLVGVISLTDIAQHEEPLRAARMVREITGRAFRFEGPKSVKSVAPPPDTPSSSRRSTRGKAASS